MGSVFASWCKCSMSVSRVHPVAIRSAVFCTVCSLRVVVFDVMGLQTVFAYSSIGRVSVLYDVSIVSLSVPHVEFVSLWRILIALRALFVLLFVFCTKVCLVSKVMPSMVGFGVVGRG